MTDKLTDLVVPLTHARLKLNTAYPDQASLADVCDEAAKELKRLTDENRRLHHEVQALRAWGNKDCTAMADDWLAENPVSKRQSYE